MADQPTPMDFAKTFDAMMGAHLEALLCYHLDGRLMLFQGLYTHEMMSGAINMARTAVGSERAKAIEADLITHLTARRQEETDRYQRTVTSVAEEVEGRHLVTLSDGQTYSVRPKLAKQARGIHALGHRIRTLSGKLGVHGFADVDVEATRPIFRFENADVADAEFFKSTHVCSYCESRVRPPVVAPPTPSIVLGVSSFLAIIAGGTMPANAREQATELLLQMGWTLTEGDHGVLETSTVEVTLRDRPTPAHVREVRSLNVAAIGAQADDAIVVFKSGAGYRYIGAAARVPEALAAPSVGQWVNGELVNRGFYRVERLSDEERAAVVVDPLGSETNP